MEWQWAADRDQPRTAVASQFDNPPYFYLLVSSGNFTCSPARIVQGVLPSQSGWYWFALGEREAGLAVTVVDPDESTVLSSPSSEPTLPASVTTPRSKVVSTSISTDTTERSRAGRRGNVDIMSCMLPA